MGLIINDKIQQLMKGYPTVSDKYNVAGGMLAGKAAVQFGDLVKLSGTTGYYEAITALSTIANVNEIGGIVVATNVKLAQEWPGQKVQVNPGEAFNLLLDGYVAVQLDKGANEHISDVKPNAKVFVTNKGAFTVSSDVAKLGSDPIPNTYFTGVVENIGTAENPVYLAEIYVK